MRFGRTVEKGFLPVFSVDTEDEAKRLLTLACQISFKGEYIARELVHKQTLTNLQAFSDRLKAAYEFMKSKEQPK